MPETGDQTPVHGHGIRLHSRSPLSRDHPQMLLQTQPQASCPLRNSPHRISISGPSADPSPEYFHALNSGMAPDGRAQPQRPVLPPILPAELRHSSSSSSSSRSDHFASRRKRHQIPAACESCRKRKAKVIRCPPRPCARHRRG